MARMSEQDGVAEANDFVARIRAYRRRELLSRVVGTACLLVFGGLFLWISFGVIGASGRLAAMVPLGSATLIAVGATLALRPKGHPPED